MPAKQRTKRTLEEEATNLPSHLLQHESRLTSTLCRVPGVTFTAGEGRPCVSDFHSNSPGPGSFLKEWTLTPNRRHSLYSSGPRPWLPAKSTRSYPQRVQFKWFGCHWVAKVELQVEVSATHSKFPQAVCFIVVTHVSTQGWDGAGVGGRSKSEGTRGWFTSMYGRNQHIIKQLSSNKK